MNWHYVGESKESVIEKIKVISSHFAIYDAPYGMISLTIGKMDPGDFVERLDSAKIPFDRMYTHCDARPQLNEWTRKDPHAHGIVDQMDMVPLAVFDEEWEKFFSEGEDASSIAKRLYAIGHKAGRMINFSEKKKSPLSTPKSCPSCGSPWIGATNHEEGELITFSCLSVYVFANDGEPDRIGETGMHIKYSNTSRGCQKHGTAISDEKLDLIELVECKPGCVEFGDESAGGDGPLILDRGGVISGRAAEHG